MTVYSDAKIKIANIISTIDSLIEGQFENSAGESALKKLKMVFNQILGKLDRASKLRDLVPGQQLIEQLNLKIYQVMPILGFILRSTNVRNSFEFVDPIQSIANQALQGRPQVVLSSEWDFIPFAWPQSLEDLKSFVLIGLPASEASNALLIPLAGHELGHAVWRKRGIEGSAANTLSVHIEALYHNKMLEFRRAYTDYDPADLTRRYILDDCKGQSVEFAACHAEEIFCDMFSYALFGESYLRAFAYILAPGRSSGQSDKYPTNKTRVSILSEIAQDDGVQLPTLQELGFRFVSESSTVSDRFVYRMAEEGVERIKPGLWAAVKDVIAQGKIIRPNPANVNRHYSEFCAGSPASNPMCLGDIINAGWRFYLDSDSGLAQSELHEKVRGLNEMILKTVEILEYKRRIANGA